MKYKKKTPKSKAWDAFSLYIRAKYADIDGTVKCVTCGKIARWKGDGMQAGHYVNSRCNSVLLNEKIVFPQCVDCNIYKHGNQNQFNFFMLKTHTKEQLEEFENLKHKKKIIKKHEWKELEIMYKEKANYLISEKELS